MAPGFLTSMLWTECQFDREQQPGFHIAWDRCRCRDYHQRLAVGSGGTAPRYVTPYPELDDGAYMAGEPSDPLFCDRELVDHTSFEMARLIAKQNIGT